MLDRKSWHGISLLTVALVAAIRPVLAQECSGNASLSDSRFRLQSSAASFKYANTVVASVVAGRRIFGGLGLRGTRDKELDAEALDVEAEMGRRTLTQHPGFAEH